MGSELQFILSLRDSINNGELLGPEIIAAGPILDDAPPEFPSRQRVSSAEEARQTVRDLQQSGIEFIKVHNLTPREVFFAIADETANLGMSFSGHVPLTVSIEEAHQLWHDQHRTPFKFQSISRMCRRRGLYIARLPRIV